MDEFQYGELLAVRGWDLQINHATGCEWNDSLRSIDRGPGKPGSGASPRGVYGPLCAGRGCVLMLALGGASLFAFSGKLDPAILELVDDIKPVKPGR